MPADNDEFVARLGVRPERPPGPGQPAEPVGSYEVFYANALPVRLVRGFVDVAPCQVNERMDVWDRHPGLSTPPFLFRGGSMITLDDPRDGPASVIADDCSGLPSPLMCGIIASRQTASVTSFNCSTNRWGGTPRILAWSSTGKTTGCGIPARSEGDGSVQVEYLGRMKHAATRTVVKVRKSIEGSTIYFEHSALSWQFRRLDDEWYLFLLPGWTFTKDGQEEQLAPRCT